MGMLRLRTRGPKQFYPALSCSLGCNLFSEGRLYDVSALHSSDAFKNFNISSVNPRVFCVF